LSNIVQTFIRFVFTFCLLRLSQPKCK